MKCELENYQPYLLAASCNAEFKPVSITGTISDIHVSTDNDLITLSVRCRNSSDDIYTFGYPSPRFVVHRVTILRSDIKQQDFYDLVEWLRAQSSVKIESSGESFTIEKIEQ